MANWVTTNIVKNDRLIVENLLGFVRGETAGVNSILGTYRKGAVHKMGDKISAGTSYSSWRKFIICQILLLSSSS